MFIIQSYPLAILFCFITMLCWGSWANTQKLTAGKWPFELFYWDYVLGIFAFSLLAAFTMGSIGSGGRSFLEDIQQVSGANFLSELTGGAVFNLANMMLTAAIAIAGMLTGSFLSTKIDGKKLQPAFGWFVLVMGIYIIIKETLLK